METSMARHTSVADAAQNGWAMVCCPLCNGEQFRTLREGIVDLFGTRAGVRLQECTCGLQLTNPQPYGTTLSSFYETEAYYTHKPAVGLKDRLRQRLQCAQMRGALSWLRLKAEHFTDIRRFAKRLAPDNFPLTAGKTFLDYGCGNGHLAAGVSRLGLRSVGIEPDPQAAAVAAAAGVTVAGNIEDARAALSLPAGRGFDRIVLRHVLEHLADPVATLSKLSRALDPNGLFYVAVPNALSWQADAYGLAWIGYDMPRHLWHFTPSTLQRICEMAGLTSVHCETVELSWFAELSAEKAGAVAQGTRVKPSARDAERAGTGAEIVMIARRS